MARDSRSSPRELQLETRHLAGILLLIAILCIASFMLGRWVERQAYRATAVGALGDGSAEPLDVEEVNRELTYFRTLEGKEAPPSVDRPEPPPEETPVRVRQRAGGGEPPEEEVTGIGGAAGGFMVQVMATRDLSAAIAMRQRLVQRGYRVALLEGEGSLDAGLHKVRVGPYPDRESAARAARKLEAEEGVGTWIP